MHTKNSGGWEEGVLAELYCTDLDRKQTDSQVYEVILWNSFSERLGVRIAPLTASAHFSLRCLVRKCKHMTFREPEGSLDPSLKPSRVCETTLTHTHGTCNKTCSESLNAWGPGGEATVFTTQAAALTFTRLQETSFLHQPSGDLFTRRLIDCMSCRWSEIFHWI